MASDEIVWQVINQQFCAFKLKYVNTQQTFKISIRERENEKY